MSSPDPGNTMAERVGDRRSRFRLYVLLNLNRLVFTALLAVGVFLFLLIGGALAVPPFRLYMVEYDPSRYVFQAFIGALISGVTLVVTISQLVLSQELGPLADQRQRMAGSVSFRGDVEDIFESASPPEPSMFLRALVENSSNRAESLRDEVADSSNEDLEKRVNQLVDSVVNNAEVVSNELEDRNFGEYAVVKAALDYNYSWKIYQARRLRDSYTDELSDEAYRTLISLIDILSFFGPAREHIKTLYFEWELVNLSRGILYIAIPALAVSSTLASYLAPTSFPGATLGIDNLVWINSAGIAISSLPFLYLAVYILRLTTLSKRTLAVGPFILRNSERSTEIEWD